MKVTEELLNKMKQDSNFSDGIIMPDGDYRLIQDGGHMEALMGLLPYTSDEIFKMVPQDDLCTAVLADREDRMCDHRL